MALVLESIVMSEGEGLSVEPSVSADPGMTVVVLVVSEFNVTPDWDDAQADGWSVNIFKVDFENPEGYALWKVWDGGDVAVPPGAAAFSGKWSAAAFAFSGAPDEATFNPDLETPPGPFDPVELGDIVFAAIWDFGSVDQLLWTEATYTADGGMSLGDLTAQGVWANFICLQYDGTEPEPTFPGDQTGDGDEWFMLFNTEAVAPPAEPHVDVSSYPVLASRRVKVRELPHSIHSRMLGRRL